MTSISLTGRVRQRSRSATRKAPGTTSPARTSPPGPRIALLKRRLSALDGAKAAAEATAARKAARKGNAEAADLAKRTCRLLFSHDYRSSVRVETLSTAVAELSTALLASKDITAPFRLSDIRRTARPCCRPQCIERRASTAAESWSRRNPDRHYDGTATWPRSARPWRCGIAALPSQGVQWIGCRQEAATRHEALSDRPSLGADRAHRQAEGSCLPVSDHQPDCRTWAGSSGGLSPRRGRGRSAEIPQLADVPSTTGRAASRTPPGSSRHRRHHRAKVQLVPLAVAATSST